MNLTPLMLFLIIVKELGSTHTPLQAAILYYNYFYFLSPAVTEQNKKNYVYFSTTKSWTSAREYCRQNSMDLAVIENSEENTEANLTTPANQDSWIGLYRVPWIWSDRSQSAFKNWRSTSPNNAGGNQHCMCESNTHVWDDDECAINYVFICHQGECSSTQRKLYPKSCFSICQNLLLFYDYMFPAKLQN
uniref:C-type lectin domain-containing protein n=1 Tax=Amphilophus citrinellus TaxID=61819 RepID=A0A3Q0QY90_AMPCI